MDKLKVNFNMSCVSFTWITLFLCIINKINIGLTKNVRLALYLDEILQIYIMCVLVQVIMYFTDKIHIENIILINIIRIIDIFIIVIPCGLYFNLFEFSVRQISLVSIMNISAYLIVTFTVLIGNKINEIYINSILNKKRSE